MTKAGKKAGNFSVVRNHESSNDAALNPLLAV